MAQKQRKKGRAVKPVYQSEFLRAVVAVVSFAGACASESAADSAETVADRADPTAEPSVAAQAQAQTAPAPECCDDGDPCTQDDPKGIVDDCVPAKCTHTDIADCSMTVGKYLVTANEVSDSDSRLTWQRRLPDKYTGCTGQFNAVGGEVGDACSLNEADSYCRSLGSGWRVPALKEFETIVSQSRQWPAIETQAFPFTPRTWNNKSNNVFWTSTTVPGTLGGRAWVVFGSTGSEWGGDKGDGPDLGLADNKYSVRCVR
jgi:Protein of unknown function (DUF1566)